MLFLRPGTREHFLQHLAEDWPEQLPHYRELYAERAYLGSEQQRPIREAVGSLAQELAIADRRPVKFRPPPRPEQLTLVG
jgi:hypothetical protein